jgi:hypothetical protein
METGQLKDTAHLEEQCHYSKNANFELCPQEVCLRPYLPSGIASHLFPKMAARGEKYRSFDAIASPKPVVFPLS